MSGKKYIVRLTVSERKVCSEVIGKLKGTGQKVRRAQMLLDFYVLRTSGELATGNRTRTPHEI